MANSLTSLARDLVSFCLIADSSQTTTTALCVSVWIASGV